MFNNLFSQVNLDFETGNTAGWTITGSASIMAGGADPSGGFPRVFPGTINNLNNSLMISNGPIAGFTDGGASQSFLVNQSNTCLILRYATVLGSAGHGCSSCSPQFVAGVYQNGVPIPCSYVNANAGCSLVGWSSGTSGSAFLPWTVVSFDLRPYIGQNVNIQLNSYDCCGGAHWAYSYVDCSAQPLGLFLNNAPIPSNQTNTYLCNGVNNIISAPAGFNYLWTGPNSNSPVNGATTQSINATEAGTYSVNLTVNGLNCSAINLWSSFGFIDVPTANFTTLPVCFGTATSFTNASITPTLNTSLGVTNTYAWNFNDLTAVDVSNSPSHLYGGSNINATYNVTLTAAAQSCTNQIVKSVFLGSIPDAVFTSDTVCFGSASQLQDNSNGNGNSLANYMWDFSFDGSVEVTGIGNPNFIFPYYGANAVSYTVITKPTAGLTCTSYTSGAIWVNPLPEPEFNFVNKCVNDQPNIFNASISSVPVGNIATYDWVFGDGQTSNLNIPNTTHVYNNKGSYNVMLTLTSNKNCVNTISHQVLVYPKPDILISASNLICLGSKTTFTANSMANSGNVVQWKWDVNNSINTFELNGKQNNFMFPTEGWHTLNLLATTDYGCSESFTRNLYINYLPKVDFIVNDPDGCPLPHCVEFTDKSSVMAPAKIINWYWNFGNGTSNMVNTNANQNACYFNTSSNQLALYSVTLIAKTDSGCVTSKTHPNMITVFPKPIAQYTVVPEFGNVVVPLVHFINQSIDYTIFNWDFGDGKANNTQVNPDHYYEGTTSEDYFSSLIVTNKYGCTDTAQVKVNITPEFVFYIPNTFSPNGDAINDEFTGSGIGIIKFEMWIYDRWGVSIFYSEDIYNAWNGQTQGKGEDAKQDVYTWKVELKDVFGKKHSYVGHVTLLR